MKFIGKNKRLGLKVFEHNGVFFRVSQDSMCGCFWWEAQIIELDKRFKTPEFTIDSMQNGKIIASSKLQRDCIDEAVIELNK